MWVILLSLKDTDQFRTDLFQSPSVGLTLFLEQPRNFWIRPHGCFGELLDLDVHHFLEEPYNESCCHSSFSGAVVAGPHRGRTAVAKPYSRRGMELDGGALWIGIPPPYLGGYHAFNHWRVFRCPVTEQGAFKTDSPQSVSRPGTRSWLKRLLSSGGPPFRNHLPRGFP